MKTARSIAAMLALAATTSAAESLKDEPSAAAFRQRVITLLEQRQAEKAAAFAMYALDHYPSDPELNLLNLDILEEEGLQDLGRPFYEERVAKFGDKPLLLYALGRLAENPDKAREYYDAALKTDADFAPVFLGLASLALARGDFAAAEGYVNQAFEAGGFDRRAFAIRGRILLARGEPDAAAEDLRRALQDEPYAPEVHAALAEAYAETGDVAAAEEEFRSAIALNDSRGEYYLGLGRALEASGNVAAARLAYAAVPARAGLNPTLAATGYGNEGRLAYAAGELDAALTPLRKAAALNPADADAYTLCGEIYARLGRPLEAAAFYGEAAKLKPDDGVLWYNFGVNLAGAGELEAAENILTKAAETLTERPQPGAVITAADAERELAAARARRAKAEAKP